MSRKLCVQFEIRNMLIMKDTLKQMGLNYNELNQDAVEVHRGYAPISINAKSGEISYDNVDQSIVDSIKQTYTVNSYKDQAIREGMQLKEEHQANGEVHLTLL
jgi:hypothetical protein